VSVPYGTDPMRIWGPHKNSWIQIQESGSICIRISFGMIHRSRPRQIRNYLHFAFRWVFLMDPDPRIRIRVRVSPNSFRKILMWYFLKKIGSAPPFSGSVPVFLQFSFDKNAVRSLRTETWIRDRSLDPRVRPRTGTIERRGTAQQRTLDPVSASGSAFRPVGTRPLLFFLWHIKKKAAGWPDPSPVLGSGPSRTDPSHPDIVFTGHPMPTMKGTVQEDDYRAEVRFKDKNLSKNKAPGSAILRIRDSDPDLNPDPGLIRWHQSGGGSAARRWIQPGLRYHQIGLGGSTHNVGTSPVWLPWPVRKEKEICWPIY
jgi:hypothetical protein